MRTLPRKAARPPTPPCPARLPLAPRPPLLRLLRLQRLQADYERKRGSGAPVSINVHQRYLEDRWAQEPSA